MNLQPEHYAYRADRSALDAVKQVHKHRPWTNCKKGENIKEMV
jgi:hypothetical protein